MELETIVKQLSDIERIALETIVKVSTEPNTSNPSINTIAKESGLKLDAIRRAVEWLNEKGLIKKTIVTREGFKHQLTQKGQIALEKGLPEIRLIEWAEKNCPIKISTALQKSPLDKEEFHAALGWNKKNNFIIIQNGEVIFTNLSKEKEFEHKLLERKEALKKNERPNELEKEFLIRQLVEPKAKKNKLILVEPTEKGKKALELFSKIQTREYNIRDPVPELLQGKKQPYIQFLNHIRRRLTELGFAEMDSPLVTQEFYNFDVLFQPQNHPARTWTDTYQLKQPQKGKLPDAKTVKSVKAMHETGGVSASNGWQYSWEEEIAKRLMPAAHGTAHSARQLVKKIRVPGKYFSIARCYRPDVVDATHLSEFTQLDGFIVGNLNFRHLLGMLKQFAIEFAGTKEVRFAPSYYPFTEPSCQLIVKHPKLGWIEVAGAGIFRPEMTENLGIKEQVLAWGIGIDRLAMIKLGINDMRQLFSDDLNWLRKQPMVVP